ncbi:MAG: tRNA (N6-threonylcarbamoyladenosine(37)-N6)-methyltransferase TrmO, partial [Muribaculaceae bacterium]|nr:tRNA (N6-threonylcarbamoyladenosine(37)-N6)-methyltransferase TrmO [Muribaculaceae bacterium]
MEIVEHKIIARIFTDLPEKFGVPRQSGLVENLCGRIVFDPDFRNPDAVRGLEHFSHLWIIWDFSLAHREEWSPTVRPPRLGGNNRVGVFASRSPFRPNSIGLSAVKIVKVEPETPEG